MKRLLAIAALSALSCGGETAVPPMEIGFSSKALLEEAAFVAIYFYDGTSTCEAVRAVLPRAQSLLGPFMVRLDDTTRDAGFTTTLDTIPVGRYVVLADAHRDNGGFVGSGCAEAQEILNQRVSPIRITINTPP